MVHYIHAVSHDDDVITLMSYEDHLYTQSVILSYVDYMISYSVHLMVLVSCQDHMIIVLLYNGYKVEVSYGPIYTRGVT